MTRIATDEINARKNSEWLGQQTQAPMPSQANVKKTLSPDDVVAATGQDPGRQSLIAKTTGNVSPARTGLEGEEPANLAADKKKATTAAPAGRGSEGGAAADGNDSKADKSKNKDLADVSLDQERINQIVRNQI